MKKFDETKSYISKSIFFTIAPFVIPLITLIPKSIINNFSKGLIIFILMAMDIYFVIHISTNDAKLIHKSKQTAFDNKKYRISQLVLNRVSNAEKVKGGFLKDETYKVHYDYSTHALFYNPHRYIERVCEELKSLLSEVTGIELEYISVSFIYKYPNFENEKWQWITGKDPTTEFDLNDLINNKYSYYHYLMKNDISSSFENDKSKLSPKHYYTSEKDNRYNTSGSISSHRITFRNNNEAFCTGYLTISTYGKKFYSGLDGEQFESANEFEQILYNQILPPFRRLIETELGFLYLRHKYRSDNGYDISNHD